MAPPVQSARLQTLAQRIDLGRSQRRKKTAITGDVMFTASTPQALTPPIAQGSEHCDKFAAVKLGAAHLRLVFGRYLRRMGAWPQASSDTEILRPMDYPPGDCIAIGAGVNIQLAKFLAGVFAGPLGLGDHRNENLFGGGIQPVPSPIRHGRHGRSALSRCGPKSPTLLAPGRRRAGRLEEAPISMEFAAEHSKGRLGRAATSIAEYAS
jgi:hypothetical protein